MTPAAHGRFHAEQNQAQPQELLTANGDAGLGNYFQSKHGSALIPWNNPLD